MTGQNDFLPFAVAPEAIVLSNAQWTGRTPREPGHKPGIASSALANKAERQGTVMAAALGMLVAEYGRDALDDGDIEKLSRALKFMIAQIGNGGSSYGTGNFTSEMVTITAQDVINGYFDLPRSVLDTMLEHTVVLLNTNAQYYGTDYRVVTDNAGLYRRISFAGLGLEDIPIKAGDMVWVLFHVDSGTSVVTPVTGITVSPKNMELIKTTE